MPEHTSCLNQLAQQIARHIKLGLVDMSAELSLHVSEDGDDLACVATQGRGEMYAVVALMGRGLTITERGYTELERLLVAAAWGVRRLANFALFLPGIRVVLPEASMLTYVR